VNTAILIGILPLLCIAVIFCSCLKVLKYLLTYKIWRVKRAKWRDQKILPHPSTCILIYGTPFEPQLEGTILWSIIILIKICGNKIRCKIKTNGYLIFNYSSFEFYEPQCSGFWPALLFHDHGSIVFCVLLLNGRRASFILFFFFHLLFHPWSLKTWLNCIDWYNYSIPYNIRYITLFSKVFFVLMECQHYHLAEKCVNNNKIKERKKNIQR
jgi:hypothetical protein